MTRQGLRILAVNAKVRGGGAERVALSIHEGLRRRGHRSWLAVGRRNMDAPGVFAIPKGRHAWLSQARNSIADALGREPFDYPGTARLPTLTPEPLDILHAHNLHRRYFDLRTLPELSRGLPLALTLHDEWTYTGHCAYTLGLETWRSGCHSCGDLAVYPPIARDATHVNWEAKRRIYKSCRLYVTTPSAWLMDRARTSILAPGVADWRVIPNGVDRTLFRPGDAGAARALLGLPSDARILLFTANLVAQSPFKDPETVFEAARRLGALLPGQAVLALALGDDAPAERSGNVELRYVPYERDAERLAAYYRAADLYLHAAHADNLPTTILEALASGLPVIATAVGGIPEEVRSAEALPGGWGGRSYGRDEATGVLVGARDAAGMAAAAAVLLARPEMLRSISDNATADAAARFDLERQVDATVDWYDDVISDWRAWVARGRSGPADRRAAIQAARIIRRDD